MAIRTRISGEAARAKVTRESRARHPLLKIGSRHHFLWTTILHGANKLGMTAAQMQASYPLYHPQILADLQKAKLVTKSAKRGQSNYYVADPAGKGINPQQIRVEVEIYETVDGAFVTRTHLLGRRENHGKIAKFLGSKKIMIDIPGEYSDVIVPVQGHVEPDVEPDDFELVKIKKATKDANVIIDLLSEGPIDGPLGEPSKDEHPWKLIAGPIKFTSYDPSKDEGCIIDG